MTIIDWSTLSEAAKREALSRPAQRDDASVMAAARGIMARVRAEGDAAVLALTEQFDRVRLGSLEVTRVEFEHAEHSLDAAQHAAIERAIANVQRFHAAQQSPSLRLENPPGV